MRFATVLFLGFLLAGCGSSHHHPTEVDLPSTPTYVVSVSVASGAGTVGCLQLIGPPTPTKQEDPGATAFVRAVPDAGNAVAEWVGTDDDTLTTNDNSVTVQNADKAATVAFMPIGPG